MAWKPVKPENAHFPGIPSFAFDANNSELGGLALYEREVMPEVYKKLLEKQSLADGLPGKDRFNVMGTTNMVFEEIENKVFRWMRTGAFDPRLSKKRRD